MNFRTHVALAAFALIGALTGRAQTWTQTTAPTNLWYAAAMSADGTKLAVAAGGETSTGPIYTSTNSGGTWIPTMAPTNHWACIATSADGTRLVAGNYGGALYTSGDWGMTWHTNVVPYQNSWVAVSVSANGLVLAAVDFTPWVYVSTDGGSSWTTNNTAVSDLESLAMSADGRSMVAANNTGKVALSTNSGATWAAGGSLRSFARSLAGSVDVGRLVAIVSAGSGLFAAYGSTNSGTSWVTNRLPVADSWIAVACSADGLTQVAVGQKAGIYSSTDAGASWAPNGVPTLQWQAVASSADGDELAAVAWNNGIWVAHAVPQPLLGVKLAGGSLGFSWCVPSTNLVLQQSGALTGTGWSDLTNVPAFNFTNLQDQVSLPVTAGSGFFRLGLP